MTTENATVLNGHPDAEIGERVHQLIWRQRISQAAFAGRLGISPSTMSKKLRGERPWSTSELIAAASTLEVSVGRLFGEDGSESPRHDSNVRPAD